MFFLFDVRTVISEIKCHPLVGFLEISHGVGHPALLPHHPALLAAKWAVGVVGGQQNATYGIIKVLGSHSGAVTVFLRRSASFEETQGAAGNWRIHGWEHPGGRFPWQGGWFFCQEG